MLWSGCATHCTTVPPELQYVWYSFPLVLNLKWRWTNPIHILPTLNNIHFFFKFHLTKHTIARTHSPTSHPPLSGLSGTWPALCASASVKPASSLGCTDARVRRLRWGCCTWQGLVLHHVFHTRLAPSCGCRRKRLWLRRRVLWLELSCSMSDSLWVQAATVHSELGGRFCCNGTRLYSFWSVLFGQCAL